MKKNKEKNSLKVAVRVRPFNFREKKSNKSKLCVEMKGDQTIVFNDKAVGEFKRKVFRFDFSFWSFDTEDENYVDNEQIFGKFNYLDQSFQGYNISLFAYGQTGSGKSFSVVGTKSNPGLIPRSCEGIFQRIEAQRKIYEEKDVSEMDRIQYTVKVSMIEIYNEKVKDLLNPKNNPPGGLIVREHPKTGHFVKDLTFVRAEKSSEVLKWLEIGNKNKTIGETKMNKTSSRAHTLFSIYLKLTRSKKTQKKIIKTDMTSKIHLVDLAGSERLRDTNRKKAQVRESININTSLHALGLCITALAEKFGGKETHVPFRDSVLTKLMKESLIGNSKTIMIAAISPSSVNYGETLSTLKYADRAKNIKTIPIVNEDEQEKKIRELKGEIKKLKKMLAKRSSERRRRRKSKDFFDEDDDSDSESEDLVSTLRLQLEDQKRVICEMEESENSQRKKAEDYMKMNLENLKKKGLIVEDASFDRKLHPHIVNLSEDPGSNMMLVYPLMKLGDVVRVGSAPENDICVEGIGISDFHCHFLVAQGEEHPLVSIVPPPLKVKKSSAEVFVNGRPLTEKLLLTTGDRLILGQHHVFKFSNPLEYSKLKEEGKLSAVSWEYARKEFVFANVEEFGSLLEEEQRRREKMQRDLERKLDEMKGLGNNSSEEEEEKNEVEDLNVADNKEEIENELAALLEESRRIENSLTLLIPLVREINFICKELDLPQKFLLKTITSGEGKKTVMVLVIDSLRNISKLIDEEKFISNYYLVKELYEDAKEKEEHTHNFEEDENLLLSPSPLKKKKNENENNERDNLRRSYDDLSRSIDLESSSEHSSDQQFFEFERENELDFFKRLVVELEKENRNLTDQIHDLRQEIEEKDLTIEFQRSELQEKEKLLRMKEIKNEEKKKVLERDEKRIITTTTQVQGRPTQINEKGIIDAQFERFKQEHLKEREMERMVDKSKVCMIQ